MAPAIRYVGDRRLEIECADGAYECALVGATVARTTVAHEERYGIFGEPLAIDIAANVAMRQIRTINPSVGYESATRAHRLDILGAIAEIEEGLGHVAEALRAHPIALVVADPTEMPCGFWLFCFDDGFGAIAHVAVSRNYRGAPDEAAALECAAEWLAENDGRYFVDPDYTQAEVDLRAEGAENPDAYEIEERAHLDRTFTECGWLLEDEWSCEEIADTRALYARANDLLIDD